MEPSTDCVDILSPLANLEWSEDSYDCPGGIAPSQVVLLRDKIYVGVITRLTRRSTRHTESTGEFYCSTTDLSSWTPLDVPGIKKFGLGIYRSHLVLVGGLNYSSKVVGDVWASEDGRKWQQSESLPPLPNPCVLPSVVNTGNPEYLIVAGGYIDRYCLRPSDTVSVLDDGQWFLVQHLPAPCGSTKFTVYNGNFYLFGSTVSRRFSYYCKVDSLISACELVKSGAASDGRSVLWRTLNVKSGGIFDRHEMPLTRMEYPTMLPVSFGQQLVAVKMYRGIRTHAEIHAYHPFTQSWVHVGSLPTTDRPACAFVHTTGELVVLCRMITRPIGRRKFKVMKATLQVSPYHPDSHFSMCALPKLEAAEIEVLTLLSKNYQQLVEAIGVHVTNDNLKLLIHCWLSGQSTRPATWRSLHEVLRELGLEELSHQIEDYLTGTKSLKEQSTSVIMSALLQQKSLELSQLYVRLPCYVPPTVKRYIIHRYAAFTHQTRCPVSPGLELESPIVLPFPSEEVPQQPRPLPARTLPSAPLPLSTIRILLHRVNPQAVPPRPVVPQAVPPHPVVPQAVPPHPVVPQAVPPHPVVPQAVPPHPLVPHALPPHPVDPQAVPPPLPPRRRPRARVLQQQPVPPPHRPHMHPLPEPQ